MVQNNINFKEIQIFLENLRKRIISFLFNKFEIQINKNLLNKEKCIF